jgi:hypothetical protein
MPIREFKDGVGLVFDVDGTPATMSIRGSAQTTYLIGWSDAIEPDPADWEHIARGTLLSSEVRIQLPLRGGGVWLLWLIDIPERPDGSFQAVISEVTFGS